MVHTIVICLGDGEKEDCPYIKTCLARLNDRTITGCGIPLYVAGFITKSEIFVQHTVKKEGEEND